MSNPKHTPGPWVAVYSPKLKTAGVVLNEQYPTTIQVEYANSSDSDHYEANARLIAAAPCMLEALIQSRGLIIQLCNDIKNNYGLDLDVNTLIRVRGIDDAIAKARGEK